MANPVFTNSRAFEPGRTVGFDVGGRQPQAETQALGFDGSQSMTYEGTIVKAASLLLVGVASAVVVGMFAPGLAGPLALVAFVMSLVTAFTTRRIPRPALFVATIGLYGGAVGGISVYYEKAYGGIIMQALIATATVFAVSLVVYRSGRVRHMSKIRKFLSIAMPAYVVFSLINVAMAMFGGFNMREVEIGGLGIRLGLVLSIAAIFMGALMLISDFDFVDNGVRNALPAQWEWTAAYGLVFAIIWIYLELLRLIGYLRR